MSPPQTIPTPLPEGSATGYSTALCWSQLGVETPGTGGCLLFRVSMAGGWLCDMDGKVCSRRKSLVAGTITLFLLACGLPVSGPAQRAPGWRFAPSQACYATPVSLRLVSQGLGMSLLALSSGG
ncbi:uncharacterized protein BO66DRAFT_196237 [Aspergillus aculeatinus CBS 121060]|uniref:Uncharacterized protein n=1 Tax=Aspergillus aculeatinus CBS 121060 TaxID=1448322 RepID=A0ACD1GWW1_9EURO|nr:hypothetical protein BO66DRAFT_196237 [Aspergillus aculeatinus CBS 121060]RAH65743.1 hypothetical protein BO66DRAFT_196237 [Aspergillus aculeatinus CBS 121060]